MIKEYIINLDVVGQDTGPFDIFYKLNSNTFLTSPDWILIESGVQRHEMIGQYSVFIEVPDSYYVSDLKVVSTGDCESEVIMPLPTTTTTTTLAPTTTTTTLEPKAKALIFNFDVIRGSSGIELKKVDIKLRESYIPGDNEQFVTLDGVEEGSVGYDGAADPVGLPQNFIPTKIIFLEAPVFNPGAGASIVSTELADENDISITTFPHSTPISLNNSNIGYVIKINTLNTGTTDSYITLDVEIEGDGGQILSRVIEINILNNT